ncbi:MAG: hypothetical protein FWF40_01245, partial [Methanomassiliicoccaceae archaeon]|nr:hypothetical protein [Methanomassiliicoccaceae archaeon]
MKLVNIICMAQDSGLTPKAVKHVMEEGYDIELCQYSTYDIDNNEKTFREMLKDAKDAFLVTVRMHAGLTYFRKFEKLKEFLISNAIPAFVESEMPEETSENRILFPGSDEEHFTIRSYMELGGNDNEYNLL